VSERNGERERDDYVCERDDDDERERELCQRERLRER